MAETMDPATRETELAEAWADWCDALRRLGFVQDGLVADLLEQMPLDDGQETFEQMVVGCYVKLSDEWGQVIAKITDPHDGPDRLLVHLESGATTSYEVTDGERFLTEQPF